jgi:hypothetical protein
MGDLNQYFDFPKEKHAHYLIYNPDKAFNEQDVYNSDFLNRTLDIILNEEYDKESVEISLNYEAARLFDEEKITWGELTASKKGDKDTKENYLFIASDLIIKFPDPKA